MAKRLRKLARETVEAVGTAVLLLQECQSFDADARLKNLAVQGSSYCDTLVVMPSQWQKHIRRVENSEAEFVLMWVGG